MKNIILTRKLDRFSLLYALYRKSNGMSGRVFNLRELASFEEVGVRAFRSAFDFLASEKLIAPQFSAENPHENYYASLTDKGIFAVENVFQDESSETTYFPSYQQMMM